MKHKTTSGASANPVSKKKTAFEPTLDEKHMPMHSALTPLFGYCFTKSALRLRKSLSESMSAAGVELPQFGLMMILAKDGPTNQIRLGDQMSIDKATMVKVLDMLEESGYVRRKADANDRRVKLVELTPKGRAQIPRMARIREEVESHFLSKLTKAEATELRRLILKIVNS